MKTNERLSKKCHIVLVLLIAVLFNSSYTYASGNYVVDSIGYSPYSYITGTSVLSHLDDVWSQEVSIGFSFNFYGQNYTSILIGENGQLSLDTTLAYSQDPYALDSSGVYESIPNTYMPANTINAVYRDIDGTNSGAIRYAYYGLAPNRVFVVSWDSIPLYGSANSNAPNICNTAPPSSFQAVLYENCSTIEIYVSNSASCTGWNQGRGVIGLLNATGTSAISAPNRNNTVWSAINEAWRFSDTSMVCSSAGPDQNICINTTATMAATGTGTWSPLASNPAATTIANPSSPTTTISGFTVAGVYSFIWAGDTMTVTVSAQIHPSVNSPTICEGQSAILTATGGTTYVWSTTQTTNSITVTPASTTTYRVTATEGTCTATASGTVTVNPLPTPTVNSPTICEGQSATLTATGGTTYAWSTTQTTDPITVTPAATTTYAVTATENGCTATASGTVTVNPLPTPTVNNPSICAGDTATLIATGGLTYTWNTLQTTSEIKVATAGTYTVTATNITGCSATASGTVTVNNCASPDTVWPGDADANHLVDNNDLLTIGLGYDSTGPVRVVQGIVWQGDPATDWDQYFSIYAPLVNFNNADCNGDGIIDADDTLAIVTNFGDTHAKTNNLPGPWRSGIPALYPVITSDTLYNNDTLITNIYLGTASMPANNIYGLAFTFNYDPLVIDSNYSVFSFIPSWLGTSANSININRNFATGQVKAAITGIDHTARGGNGQIASFRGIVTTDNINGKDYSYYTNRQYISDITAIDQYGNPVLLNAGVDSNYVGWFVNGIRQVSEPTLSIYPDPASTQVRVSADVAISSVTIIDMLGEVAQTINGNNQKTEMIDISQLSAGVYTVRVSAAGGTATAKLVVSR